MEEWRTNSDTTSQRSNVRYCTNGNGAFPFRCYQGHQDHEGHCAVKGQVSQYCGRFVSTLPWTAVVSNSICHHCRKPEVGGVPLESTTWPRACADIPAFRTSGPDLGRSSLVPNSRSPSARHFLSCLKE